MPIRLVALDEGADIALDRDMLIVGRHPQCDARLDSIRVSRRHCCMTPDHGEVVVRDLGSTNGIRINGQRVEKGRLRIGDELSIAHIRFRLDDGQGQEMTLAEPLAERLGVANHGGVPNGLGRGAVNLGSGFRPAIAEENPLAAAVREMLPASVAEKCRIQVIVKMEPEAGGEDLDSPCPPDSSH